MRCSRRLLGGWLLGLAASAQAGLPDVIAQARPSVLPIGTFDPLRSPRFDFRGTAFVVGNGRYVITNEHVVTIPDQKSPRFALRLPHGDTRGEWRMAEVVAQDKAHDLALLRIEGAALPALRLGAAGAAREGQSVALMGFPIGGILGFQPVTHRGIIASIAAIALPAANAAQLGDRSIVALRSGAFDVYQLDATAYPGNSGGPVFDADTGEVIAVVNMVLVRGSRETALQHPTGISYAIPIRYVRELLDANAR